MGLDAVQIGAQLTTAPANSFQSGRDVLTLAQRRFAPLKDLKHDVCGFAVAQIRLDIRKRVACLTPSLLPHGLQVTEPCGLFCECGQSFSFANDPRVILTKIVAAVRRMRDKLVDPALAFAPRGVGRMHFFERWTQAAKVIDVLPKHSKFVGSGTGQKTDDVG
jgi:hypothetical protein